jgi:hypothetical protein
MMEDRRMGMVGLTVVGIGVELVDIEAVVVFVVVVVMVVGGEVDEVVTLGVGVGGSIEQCNAADTFKRRMCVLYF